MKAYIKDIIINIGHKIFNIFIPVLLLMCIQWINLYDKKLVLVFTIG